MANVTRDALMQGFASLGVEAGDAVLVHSAYLPFGDIAGGADAVVDALQATVREHGTLVLPSFNWDYFRKPEKVIDLVHTPSRMGRISETFRRRPGVRRTRNLFHPLCVWGRLADDLLACDMFDTWGEASPYSLMYRTGFKILLLGVDLNTCSILHYCEQRANAWYRVPVIYDGTIVDETGRRHPTRCRRLATRPGCLSDLNKAQTALTPANSRDAIIGNAVCRAIDLPSFVDAVGRSFDADRDYLLKTTPLWHTMPTLKNAASFTAPALVERLAAGRRTAADPAHDALEHLRSIIPMKLRRVDTDDGRSPQVGEYARPGLGDRTVVVPVVLGDRGADAEALGGVAVAVALARRLMRLPYMRHGYRIIFAPDALATKNSAWREDRGLHQVECALGFAAIGTGRHLTVRRSASGDARIDRIAAHVARHRDDEVAVMDFSDGAGDARILQAMDVDAPSVAIGRAPGSGGPQEPMDDALELAWTIIEILETDVVPRWAAGDLARVTADASTQAIMESVNDRNSAFEIAETLGRPYAVVLAALRALEKTGMVTCAETR